MRISKARWYGLRDFSESVWCGSLFSTSLAIHNLHALGPPCFHLTHLDWSGWDRHLHACKRSQWNCWWPPSFLLCHDLSISAALELSLHPSQSLWGALYIFFWWCRRWSGSVGGTGYPPKCPHASLAPSPWSDTARPSAANSKSEPSFHRHLVWIVSFLIVRHYGRDWRGRPSSSFLASQASPSLPRSPSSNVLRRGLRRWLARSAVN